MHQPEFTVRREGSPPTMWPICSEQCMKMKEFWDESPLPPHPDPQMNITYGHGYENVVCVCFFCEQSSFLIAILY